MGSCRQPSEPVGAEWAGGWAVEERRRPVGGRNLGTLVDKHLKPQQNPLKGGQLAAIFSLEDTPTISWYSGV